jgi:hypothetical protein
MMEAPPASSSAALAAIPPAAAGGDRLWRLPGLYKPAPRKRAALAAADALLPRLAAQPGALALCGRDAVVAALDAAAVGGDPVRRRLLGHLEALGSGWGTECSDGGGGSSAAAPAPAQVLAAVADAYAAQRMCAAAAAPPSAQLLAAFERARAAAASSPPAGAGAPAAAVDADGFDVEEADDGDDDIVLSAASRNSSSSSSSSSGGGRKGRGQSGQQPPPRDADAYGAALVRSARAHAQELAGGGSGTDAAASKRQRADHQQQQHPPQPPSYSAADFFFGWDPRAGPPPTGYTTTSGGGVGGGAGPAAVDARSPWALMRAALTHTYRAERAGVPPLGGARFADVLRWLPLFRPYKAPSSELPRAAFSDQCALVPDVVLALSDGGVLAMHPALLPHEFYFLREQLPLHIRARVRESGAVVGEAGWAGAGRCALHL